MYIHYLLYTRGPLAAATAAPPADISLRGGGGPASLLGGDRERCGHRAALHRARRRSRRMAARGLASDRSSSPQVPALRTASPMGSASGTAAGLPRPQRAPSPGRGEDAQASASPGLEGPRLGASTWGQGRAAGPAGGGSQAGCAAQSGEREPGASAAPQTGSVRRAQRDREFGSSAGRLLPVPPAGGDGRC